MDLNNESGDILWPQNPAYEQRMSYLEKRIQDQEDTISTMREAVFLLRDYVERLEGKINNGS